jgi:hypothetical protein
LFAVPEVGLLQDYNSLSGTNTTPTHAFNATFDVGKSYALTIGIMGGEAECRRRHVANRSVLPTPRATSPGGFTSITNSAENFPTTPTSPITR